MCEWETRLFYKNTCGPWEWKWDAMGPPDSGLDKPGSMGALTSLKATEIEGEGGLWCRAFGRYDIWCVREREGD